ncbi:tRNA (N6-threonylcarbamoyladenosine(37)-N6)-methyltransferase TrmO [Paraglaciecola sp. 2405UD69-4]|uniref:tRNA (N6-threonylcarbamoyladenosine(37)-N6)-methyltransferase TrmO n=1 Tax=Paraglaciecola sp. 2405UD69-4 TaxID=3391836 RepID=UPI0039C9A376
MKIAIQPIGKIHTPYQEKFAIPRQPGLVKSATGVIYFEKEFNDPNYLRGLESFSHLWLLFHFHQTAAQGFKPLVRPPRLGGNQKQGVFATRSTFRPNGIGMSVVEFASIDNHNKQLSLTVKGVDLLDGTPILDIKPYLPYADNLFDAKSNIAQVAPSLMEVEFSAEVQGQISKLESHYQNLKTLIQEVLAQDPRPAYHKATEPDKTYGMSLFDLNINWQVVNQKNIVVSVQKK